MGPQRRHRFDQPANEPAERLLVGFKNQNHCPVTVKRRPVLDAQWDIDRQVRQPPLIHRRRIGSERRDNRYVERQPLICYETNLLLPGVDGLTHGWGDCQRDQKTTHGCSLREIRGEGKPRLGAVLNESDSQFSCTRRECPAG